MPSGSPAPFTQPVSAPAPRGGADAARFDPNFPRFLEKLLSQLDGRR